MSFDYYVRADGTASKDDATGPPSDPSKAMSLATFNASNFAPGDRIGFSDQGGDFQGQLTIPSSGTDGTTIVYAGLPGETPTFHPSPGALSEPTILVRHTSHIELENLHGTGQGGAAVFRFDGNSKDVMVTDSHVLSNRSADGTEGGDGFSLDGTAEVVFHNISTQATGQLAGSGPPQSDQAITTHGSAKAWVYGFDFRDAESWAVSVDQSELRLYDGVARDAQQEAFRTHDGALIEVYRSDIEVGGTARFGNGDGVQRFIDSDITVTGGRISLLTGETSIEGGTLVVDSDAWRIQTISPEALLKMTGTEVTVLSNNGSLFFVDNDGGSLQIDGVTVDGVSSPERFAQFRAQVESDNDSWIRNSEFNDFETSRLIWVSEGFQGSLDISGNSFHNTQPGGGAIDDDGAAGSLTISDNSFSNVANPLSLSPIAIVFDNIFEGDETPNNLSATAYNDILVGRGGNDSLFGGDGDDSLLGGGGEDDLVGGAGLDTASYADASEGLIIRLELPQFNTGDASGDSYSGIENIVGSGFDDLIYGDGGDNVLHGGEGNDRLLGRAGNDSVFGEGGNDRIYAQPGSNLFDGGEGEDIVDYAFATEGVTVQLAGIGGSSSSSQDTLVSIEHVAGGAFDDQLTGDQLGNRLQGKDGNDLLTGLTGNDTLFGGEGDDTLHGGEGADELFGGGGLDTASYVDASQGLIIRLELPKSNTGDANGDSYSSIENVTGSAFDDLIYGDGGDNVLRGGEGNDRLLGRAGNDSVFGEGGNDRIYAQSGSNLFDGGEGEDIVDYAFAAGPVVVALETDSGSSDSSQDTLVSIEHAAGSAFNDQLAGDQLGNRLQGKDGNDLLTGLAGDDTLFGGDGDDSLLGGEGGDELFGGAGRDTASYASASTGLTIRLEMPQSNTGDASGDSYNSVENITGSAFDDLIYGDGDDNVVHGGDGNDRLLGRAGNDSVFGEGGNDRIYAQPGSNLFDGGEGEDVVDYAYATEGVSVELSNSSGNSGTSQDSLVSIEHVAGSAFDDQLTGDQLENRLQGKDGNDTLRGGEGDDDLFGGAGDDRFVFAAGDGNDTIWDFGTTAGDADLVVLIGFDQPAPGAHPVDTAEQVGNHVHVELGVSQSLVLRNFDIDDLSEDLFLFS